MSSTPAALGYTMPAEWEEHEATWLSWPKDPNTFPPEILGAVEDTYVRMVEALASGEEVRILVDDAKTEARISEMLSARKNVTFTQLKTADVWVRDYAPIYVRGKDLAVTKWTFNAWGDKYDDLMPDNEAGWSMARRTGLRVFDPGMVLEGGSVEVNGRGTLITTEQCLLNPNRNTELDRTAIETRLKDFLGVGHIVWLGSGIEGDDTDGHVDDIARFISPDAIALAWERDPSDPNHRVLEDDLKRLRDSEDQSGDVFDIVTVPMPKPVVSAYGRLPASHLNYYVGNAAVLVPTFDSPTDAEALELFAPYFPGRKVVGIDCRSLVYGLGAIHCVTQQVPAPKH